jgi:RNA polymerase sigma-70 factor (family 1)
MRPAPEYQDEFSFLQAFKAGRRAALKQLYALHYKPLWAYAARILADEALAEDVVAESFVKLWERREQFEHFRAMMSFLYLITRNACLNHLRKDKKRNASHDQLAYLAEKSADSVHSLLVRSELLQLILLEASALPPRIREVFRLIYQEGLSIPEISEQLNVSVHTVRAQRAAALQKIRDGLADKKELLGLLLFLFILFPASPSATAPLLSVIA